MTFQCRIKPVIPPWGDLKSSLQQLVNSELKEEEQQLKMSASRGDNQVRETRYTASRGQDQPPQNRDMYFSFLIWWRFGLQALFEINDRHVTPVTHHCWYANMLSKITQWGSIIVGCLCKTAYVSTESALEPILYQFSVPRCSQLCRHIYSAVVIFTKFGVLICTKHN